MATPYMSVCQVAVDFCGFPPGACETIGQYAALVPNGMSGVGCSMSVVVSKGLVIVTPSAQQAAVKAALVQFCADNGIVNTQAGGAVTQMTLNGVAINVTYDLPGGTAMLVCFKP